MIRAAILSTPPTMAFPPQFLDELRARAPLPEIIGRKVKLTRRGREYVGLCPFHNEKTPSFTVNEDKGFFHCFGCGAHGDVIGFVMREANMSFPEAVERLAGEAGLAVPVSSPEERERAERAKSLYDVVEAATAWFEGQLAGRAGQRAREYLDGRGLGKETVARFRLGWAPDQRQALKAALTARGLKEAELVEAGLLRKPDDGRESYDYFRGRVVFPILDRRGRAIAFGGRTLGDGQPKYLNSPDSPLFRKGQVLYGLSHALESARKTNELIVTEGYIDVIALHQAGFETAVAPLGTALTEAQIELMWRVAPEPVLCFDGDAAGQRAAFRAAERVLPLLKPGHSLRFATLPSGADPDSLIRDGGPGAMSEVLARARPLGGVVWEMETAGRAADTPERRAHIRKRLMDRAYGIADRSVQHYYLEDFQARLDAAYRRRSTRGGGRKARRPGSGRPWEGREDAGLRADGNVSALATKVQLAFLASVIYHPELLDEVGEELGSRALEGERLDSFRREIIKMSDSGLDSAGMQSHLKSLGFVDVLERVLARDVYEAAPFCHPGKPTHEVAMEWRAVWGRFWQRQAKAELDADARALGEDMTAERWTRLAAKKTHYEDSELGDPDDRRAIAGRPEGT